MRTLEHYNLRVSSPSLKKEGSLMRTLEHYNLRVSPPSLLREGLGVGSIFLNPPQK